jgi:hypothetical protein
MLTREELAKLVIETLDGQKRFFKTRADGDLVKSKDNEKRLRHEAERILEGDTLFDRGLS